MNVFDQYGIKEVCDVTLYSIHKKQDGSGEVYYVPALYLDTLKVSSVEKTAENTWAQGGHGNSRLINWDYGKQINVTLEDALCNPASLGLCWGGALNADWRNGSVDINTDVCYCKNPVKRIARMEKAFFSRQEKENSTVSDLLPRLKTDVVDKNLDLLKISSVVDGTKIQGNGVVAGHTYGWKMAIESAVKSIAQVPDRFFDVRGRAYRIDQNRKVSVASLPTYVNYKDAVIYRINSCFPIAHPAAKIIFDADAPTSELVEVQYFNEEAAKLTVKEIIDKKNALTERKFYEGGFFSIYENTSDVLYFSPDDFNKVVEGKANESDTYDYKIVVYKVADDMSKYTAGTLIEYKDDVLNDTLCTYFQNKAASKLYDENGVLQDKYGILDKINTFEDIEKGDYLAIIVDNSDNYHALIGVNKTVKTEGLDANEFAKDEVVWSKPTVDVDVTQFKGLDMWIRFQSINEMIYFMLTKYENDIVSINPAIIEPTMEGGIKVDNKVTTVEENEDDESKKLEGKLWAYVNPRTMKPYADDYWFHYNEPLYKKSLTIAPAGKRIKGNKIVIKADQWPGMYMMVGETYIRDRDTGSDEHLQLKFPLCKVRSDNTITLQADGDPTTFNLNLEIARPQSGAMMEITAYETAKRLIEGEDGCFYEADGSTEVLSE